MVRLACLSTLFFLATSSFVEGSVRHRGLAHKHLAHSLAYVPRQATITAAPISTSSWEAASTPVFSPRPAVSPVAAPSSIIDEKIIVTSAAPAICHVYTKTSTSMISMAIVISLVIVGGALLLLCLCVLPRKFRKGKGKWEIRSMSRQFQTSEADMMERGHAMKQR